VARITGILGAVYMGSTPTRVADVYDWTFQSAIDLHPVDIKGDAYHKWGVGAAGATFSAKRRVETTGFFSGIVLTSAAANADGVPDQTLFRLDLIDSQSGFTQITGQGFISAGSLNAPQDAVDDTIEITLDGVWTQT